MKNKSPLLEQKENPQEEVTEVLKSVVDKNITQKQLKEITGNNVHNINIMVGKDSYLKDSLSSKESKKYNLDKYINQQTEYANAVEDLIIKNYEYKVKDSNFNQDGTIIQEIEILSYYYHLYMADVIKLQIKLYELSGGDISKIETEEAAKVDFYKAKVKAMQLIDPYISDYENYVETLNFSITLEDGKKISEQELATLISNATGLTYSNMNFSKQENVNEQINRISNYIEAGINQGILDEQDPLKLK